MAKETRDKIKNSSTLFITSFNMMPVSEQDLLRSKLKEIEASLFMIKNRIAKRTLKELDQENIASLLQGPTAIALGGRDSVSVSKALVNFAGQHETFKILGAYIDDELLDASSVKRLASIPSREVLLAQVIGGLNSPIQGLVNTLSATIKKFVLVIDRIREKK